MVLPRLYPIIDLACFTSAADPASAIARFAEGLLEGGATLLQLRDKTGEMRRFLSCARELRRITRGRATLIINDRADLAIASDADGVHLGQDDLSPETVRTIFDTESHSLFRAQESRARSEQRMGQPLQGGSTTSSNRYAIPKIIGVSTHSLEQVKLAEKMPIDYLAIGPVFATSSKSNPDPVTGLKGVHEARAVTRKPLVAIGGITRRNCCQVIEAGADSVAVISDLMESPVKAVEDFLQILG